tara:strand:+ start:282 stop:494 length:213 start_codon:yes stop_codon:yes gene_type:complete
MGNLFYDIFIFGFKVQITPHRVSIYDDTESIEDNIIPDKIVRYCISEGFCDTFLENNYYDMKVEVMRRKQ